MQDICFERAKAQDAQEIAALYRSLIHAPHSTWSEDYPTIEDVRQDLAGSGILLAREAGGRIVAAISICEEEELEGIAPWYADVTKFVSFARLGVAMDYQGQGLARQMLTRAMEIAKAQGYEAVRFLVAKSNPIAQRSYAKLGFDVCGEHEMWGYLWLCYQKRL